MKKIKKLFAFSLSAAFALTSCGVHATSENESNSISSNSSSLVDASTASLSETNSTSDISTPTSDVTSASTTSDILSSETSSESETEVEYISAWSDETQSDFTNILGEQLPLAPVSVDYFEDNFEDDNKIQNIWISDDYVGDQVSNYAATLVENGFTKSESNTNIYYKQNSDNYIVYVQVTYNAFVGEDYAFNIIAWKDKGVDYYTSFPTEKVEEYLGSTENCVIAYEADTYYYQYVTSDPNYISIFSPVSDDSETEESYKSKLLAANWTVDESNYDTVGIEAKDENNTVEVWFYVYSDTFVLSVQTIAKDITNNVKIDITADDFSSDYSDYETTKTKGNMTYLYKNIHDSDGIQFKNSDKGSGYLYNTIALEDGVYSITFNEVDQASEGNEQYQGYITVYASDTINGKQTKIIGSLGTTNTFILEDAKYFTIVNEGKYSFNCSSISIVLNTLITAD